MGGWLVVAVRLATAILRSGGLVAVVAVGRGARAGCGRIALFLGGGIVAVALSPGVGWWRGTATAGMAVTPALWGEAVKPVVQLDVPMLAERVHVPAERCLGLGALPTPIAVARPGGAEVAQGREGVGDGLGRARLLVRRDFRWRDGGPVKKTYGPRVMSEFLDARFKAPLEFLRFESRVMSPESAAVLKRRLERVVLDFNELAEVDSSVPSGKRVGVALLTACRPWEFSVVHALKRRS